MAFAKLSGSLLACRETAPAEQPSPALTAASVAATAPSSTGLRLVESGGARLTDRITGAAIAPSLQDRHLASAPVADSFDDDKITPFDPALRHHLKALKLSAFLREYDELARHCAAGGLGHADFLLHLAQLELGARERRLAERRIKDARFPLVKNLDSFDFPAVPSLDKSLVLDLAHCEYVARKENIIVIGDCGTGKTHLAIGLGLAACWKGISVGFFTASSLVQELLETRAERRLLTLQRRLAGYGLLIIDDLGYVPLPNGGAELLFDVVGQRCEQGSTIITSNLPTTEWVGVFGNARLGDAFLDRLTHRVHVLELHGESYRHRRS